MKVHNIFFWFTCFFLAGVFVASVASNFAHQYLIAGLFVPLIIALFFFARSFSTAGKDLPLPRVVVVAILAMIAGSVYFFAFDYFKTDYSVPLGQKVEFSGIVREAEQRIDGQKLVVSNIQIAVKRYPKFNYGDEIKVSGVIKEPPPEAANYFKKEGIVGLMAMPNVELVGTGLGSPVKAALLSIRDYFEASFKKVLPFDKATFLSGLTLGDTSEFSDDFKEELKATGTSHLVALSGYNISIIVETTINLLALWWFTKKFSFWISSAMVLGFVMMTGAEASVMRAAIMGFLILLADKLHRVYYFRNAVAATALVMVAVNPHILAFDIGFQLSFMALFGITYLSPWIQRRFKISAEPGFLSWRKNLLATTSAQLAVLPILLYQFGYFSPIGLLANVLILEFVPITMGLGFFIGFASLLWLPLAWLLSFPTSALLGYELGIIHFFAKIINIF